MRGFSLNRLNGIDAHKRYVADLPHQLAPPSRRHTPVSVLFNRPDIPGHLINGGLQLLVNHKELGSVGPLEVLQDEQ